MFGAALYLQYIDLVLCNGDTGALVFVGNLTPMFVRLFLYSESMSLESTKGLVAGHYCFVRKTLFLVALQCAFRIGGTEASSKYPVVL